MGNSKDLIVVVLKPCYFFLKCSQDPGGTPVSSPGVPHSSEGLASVRRNVS